MAISGAGVTMKLRVSSDLHIEFYAYEKPVSYKGIHENEVIPIMEDDAEQTLILAGDITMAKKINEYVPFFEGLSKRFKHIIYIMGNHEHYRFHFLKTLPTIREALRHLPNIHVLENNEIYLDGVVFFCATLWTNFKEGDTYAMAYAGHGMSDYHVIENGPIDMPSIPLRLHPEDTLAAHKETMEKMEKMFKAHKKEKVVIVTHHLPSALSTAYRYKDDPLSPAFNSNLDSFIEKYQPAYWIHGHTHLACRYKIGATEVVCNPLSYGKGNEQADEVPEDCYNPRLVIEV